MKTVEQLERELQEAKANAAAEQAREEARIARLKAEQEARLVEERAIWEAIREALISNAPKGRAVSFTVARSASTHYRTCHFLRDAANNVVGMIHVEEQDQPRWERSPRKWTVAVDGAEYGRGSRRRFPQKKDGKHSYNEIAKAYWEATVAREQREAARKRDNTTRETNAGLELALHGLAYRNGMRGINASTVAEGYVTVDVNFQRTLTEAQTRQLATMLKEFLNSVDSKKV